MSINIITPSVRPELLPIVAKCLRRQTFPKENWEWLIGAPHRLSMGIKREIGDICDYKFVLEPLLNDGDFYGLNKSWNSIFKEAKGELYVFITDGIWFTPDLLERFWDHYQNNKMACVGAIGHQYDQLVNGKPENMVWSDPRARTDFGTFYEIKPNDLEFCVASVPRQAVFDVGGVDEEYDKVAALSEKEMCIRMDQLGYKFFLDQSLEYRAIKHPRLNDQWDKKFNEGISLYNNHIKQIKAGNRLKLGFLDNTNA